MLQEMEIITFRRLKKVQLAAEKHLNSTAKSKLLKNGSKTPNTVRSKILLVTFVTMSSILSERYLLKIGKNA